MFSLLQYPMQNTIPKDIDDYIAQFPKEVQQRLEELRKIVHETVPEVEETISYKMATFTLHGKYLAYMGGFKKHIGFYPFPSGVKEFQKEKLKYKTSTGTIQFPIDEPLPEDVIERILKFRVSELLSKLSEKGKY